jgi:predicted N-formylglutamate amidohydrolase
MMTHAIFRRTRRPNREADPLRTVQQPYRIINPDGPAAFVIIGDHASNLVRPEFDDLGLPASEPPWQFAWSVGSAGIAERPAQATPPHWFPSPFCE